MIWIPVSTDITSLRREIAETELRSVPNRSGWAKGKQGGPVHDGWIHGLRNALLNPQELSVSHPTLREEIHRFVVDIDALYESVTQILVNELGPGAELGLHRDGPPYRERWHLVINSNRNCLWWDAINGALHLKIGWNGPVPYCGVLHRMTNGGDRTRTHVVLDIDRESLVR